jgi:hypothetical protein
MPLFLVTLFPSLCQILFLVWLKIVAMALVGFWAVRELVAQAKQLLSTSVTFVWLPQV